MCGAGALLRLRSRVTGAQEGRSLELELECDAASVQCGEGRACAARCVL